MNRFWVYTILLILILALFIFLTWLFSKDGFKNLEVLSYAVAQPEIRIKEVSRRGTKPCHILVMGDSIALGVGASKDENTIAGQINKMTDCTVTTRAFSGARLDDLQYLMPPTSMPYTGVFVSLGANGYILNFDYVSPTQTQQAVVNSFAMLRHHIPRRIPVYWSTFLDLKQVPLWNSNIVPIMPKTKTLKHYMKHLSREYDIHVDTYDDVSEYSNSLFSKDQLHPSDIGYRMLSERIVAFFKNNGK